jgi:hypothetical protein
MVPFIQPVVSRATAVFRSTAARSAHHAGGRRGKERAASLRAEQRLAAGGPIGVGTVITGRPLHRPRRTDFPYRVLALRQTANITDEEGCTTRAGGIKRWISRCIRSHFTVPFWLRRDNAWCQWRLTSSRNRLMAPLLPGMP